MQQRLASGKENCVLREENTVIIISTVLTIYSSVNFGKTLVLLWLTNCKYINVWAQPPHTKLLFKLNKEMVKENWNKGGKHSNV